MFILDRIKLLNATDERFDPPKDFTPLSSWPPADPFAKVSPEDWFSEIPRYRGPIF